MDRRRGASAPPVWVFGLCLLGLAGCSNPAPPPEPPAAPKRKVLLEIDRMQGTPVVELEHEISGRKISLQSIYDDAGIELEIRQDQVDLPRRDEVGLADLHAMMSAFRSIEAPPDVMRVHALVLTREQGDPDTLGIMFDFGEDDVDGRPREGFAIFADPHDHLPGGPKAELLLTLAHELAHCFNLHHPDWEGDSFGSGSTVESYSQADSVRWSLSGNSKTHLRADPGREVWPGRSNIAFGFVTQDHLARHRPSPSEMFNVVDPGNFTERRPGATLAMALRQRMARRDRSAFLPAEGKGVQLRLEAPKQSYVVGEPVVLTVGLHNAGDTSQRVLPLLDPKYRFLNVEVRFPDDPEFSTFQPVLLADARGARMQVLEPGQSIHDEARVFFGSGGWVFKQAGSYEIRADYPAPVPEGRRFEDHGRLQSNVLNIIVKEPTTAPDRRARQLLGDQEGLFLLLGSGDHLKKAVSNLKQAVAEAPTAAQAPAIHLALGTAALNPTITAASGVQSQPRLEEAQGHLRATLNARLPALSVVKAQAELAETLEDHGRHAAAKRVRTETVQRMGGHESAKEPLDQIRRPAQRVAPKPVARPPG
ncbi:MAG: hypothetical protein ACRD26_18440 [Vicinamibacterales bacterium]